MLRGVFNMTMDKGTVTGRNFTSYSDREFVTMVEALPAFQVAGSAAQEALLRLARHCGHELWRSDRAVTTHASAIGSMPTRRYNSNRE